MAGGQRLWVQGRLLAAGHARAYSTSGNAACMGELLAQERAARIAGLGLWSSAAYRVLEATDERALLSKRNSFVVVEGVMHEAAQRGGRMYLNFGDDWRRDFTAVVPPRLLREAPDAAAQLTAMIGKRVRVRGWIERRNGPSIEVQSLAEIEDAEASAVAAGNEKRPVDDDTGAPQ